MRKTLLLLIALSISLAFWCFTNAQLEINDVLNNWTPKADDAYQRILNEYEDFRWYEDTSNLTCSAIDEITISSNAVNDGFLDQANKYILIYSPYQIEKIRNWDSSIDKSKIKVKIKEITPNEEEISFTITSEDIETDKDYYGIIVPADIFETIWRPSNELYFNISKNTCEIQHKKVIKLKPWLNTFSTPAILKSISFWNGWNNISFSSMKKWERKAMAVNSTNVKTTVKPLEGYIIRNSNSSDVTMTIEYDTDNSDSLTLSKNLDAWWNFLWITKRNNPFNDIANTTATMVLDLTDWWSTNYIQIGKTFLEASTFMLWKAYAVFVNNSDWIYGGVNNYWWDSQCVGMDQANVNHEYNNGIITLRRTAIEWDVVQIGVFDPEEEVYKNLWNVNMSDEKFDYTTQWDGERNFMLTNGCKEVYYKATTNSSTQYSTEIQQAYERAISKWIISDTSIEEANMYEGLTNLGLADIMGKYAENVLNQTPDPYKSCTFDDISTLTQEEQNIIKKACQLWLMPGDKTSTSFNPNDTGIRATFGTALSRAIWWDLFEWWTPYYSGHLNALKNAGIITQIDNPENRAEIKWYVLLILMNIDLGVDCEDPTIQLACASGSDECPEVCKPDIISLTNNLTETVIFNPSDTSEKFVFNWSYTATEDFDVMWISVEELNKKEFIRWDTIDFNVIINWEEVTNYPISCDIECDIESCVCGYWGWTSTNDSVYTINKWDVVNIQVIAEFNWVYSSNDTYIYNVILRDFSWNVNRFISMDLAPIKIVKNNDIKVEIATGQNTVLLAAQNQKIAEFTVLSRDTNTASFDNLIISFSWADIDSDDIRVKIDGKEYDAEDSNHLTWISYLYEPNEVITSSGAKVQIYLKNIYTWALDTTLVSINGEEQNRTFSKRFEEAIAYIENQQDFGGFTRFTAGVDTNETNATVSNLILRSNWEKVAEILWEFSDGTEFDGEWYNEIKYIDEIQYNIWTNTIKIQKSQYEDYFRVWSEYAKIFRVGK